jgi:NodT family efflux transporter outer membrane factor (OMF) lipoprotein
MRALAGWLLGAPLAFGCASIEQPPDDLARAQVAVPDSFAAAGDVTAEAVRDDWLVELGDPALSELVAEAERNNPDLAASAARWEAARARLGIAASFLQPRLDAIATASRSDQGVVPASDRFEVGLGAAWEADLWGRLRSGEAAAAESAMAFALDHEFARQSLAAAVADAWVLAVAASLQQSIDAELVDAERFTARVTLDRIEVGAASRLDADVAEANLFLAEDAVSQSEAALLEALKALEVLVGRYPASELAVARELPGVPTPPPVGVPAQLLERRPDLLAAERRVASAFHGTEATRAARLPRVTLSASLGALLDPTESIWSFGALVLAPLYTGGELESAVREATAEQELALAEYVSVALDAFREVESALANESILTQRQAQLESAEERMRSAGRIAQDRYEAGIIGILDLTQVRRQDFATRSQVLRVRTGRLRQRIGLYLALGGSFDRLGGTP